MADQVRLPWPPSEDHDLVVKVSGQIGGGESEGEGSENETPEPIPVQKFGSFVYDMIADGADLTKTAADIVNDAISKSATIKDENGVSVPLAAEHFIANITVSLKPVGGHGRTSTMQVAATASDGFITINGGITDIDPTGTRAAGIKRDGIVMASDFQSIFLKSGSIAVVNVIFASVAE